MAFVARQFIYPFSSGPSVGINSVMANSRPSIRYELIHSLNRPRFTVCPGQTWNVAPTRNEKFMSFQRPDWHRGKRANPVSGVRQPHTTGFTRMWAILKVRITEETRPGSNTGYLFREGTHLPKKSILATQITALIHSHLSPVWMGTQLLIPLMETHNGINLAVFHLMFLTVRHFLLYQME